MAGRGLGFWRQGQYAARWEQRAEGYDAVPTECFQIVLTRTAREAESKLFFLMFNDTLRRVGDYCTARQGSGGARVGLPSPE
jgi:hypothetical protein